MESLTSGAKGITLNDDLTKTSQERLDLFYVFVKVGFTVDHTASQFLLFFSYAFPSPAQFHKACKHKNFLSTE